MSTIIVLLGVIVSVAQMTQAERKVMGACQRRIGPNQVGQLQPFADGIKLQLKETVQPQESNNWQYQGAPQQTFYQAQQNWQIQPQEWGIAISELVGGGIIIMIAISELGIYGTLFSGWASNSKFSLIGSLRSTAQMISYSVTLSCLMAIIVMMNGTVNLHEIMYSGLMMAIPLFPILVLFIISAVAETNRAPMDLPEAESELVAGFMTEYSAFAFAMFFLGEYTNILTISCQTSAIFLGESFSSVLGLVQVFFMQWQRASLPRQRFDQLLIQGWSHILPFTMGYLLALPAWLFAQDFMIR